ncbi:glycosyltransferase family 2 protein [Paenibacillus sp. MWE-103]|uniref:Glycosyltransferase family 2 protein n=1 Tax=Paenibacillus artemisiicola TaxID=1172618 RepID=A0ABS3WL40_9BACL|nr:glycosyltransferase [Paenibacillus artemisiicola]MBO7749054.1 glycosyltransferase family 2 protein [Paenibacillus artemisiicola]
MSGTIAPRKASGNKLTAMMQVRNEAGRYLEAALADLSEVVDEIVIVDDASEDGTPDICRSFPKVVRLVRLSEPLFGREGLLRQLLWQEAVKTEPDWLLSIDADEFFERKAKTAIRALIDQDRYDWIAFRMYDFWGSLAYYRDDELWQLHKRHTMMLVRYMPLYAYAYPDWDHHVPRLPLACSALPGFQSELRVKHYGWAGDEAARRAKYERYMRLDPEGKWGSLAQYASILDPNPRLVRWREEEEARA